MFDHVQHQKEQIKASERMYQVLIDVSIQLRTSISGMEFATLNDTELRELIGCKVVEQLADIEYWEHSDIEYEVTDISDCS